MTADWNGGSLEELSNAAKSIAMARTLLEDYRGEIGEIERHLDLHVTLDNDIIRLGRIEIEIQMIVAAQQFRQVVAIVSDGTFVRPKDFAIELDLTLPDLAQLAGVPRDIVTTAESPKVQKFLRESLRVLKAALQLSRDYERARSWFRTEPIQPLGNKTAAALVSEGESEQVLRYINSLCLEHRFLANAKRM